MRGKRPIFRLKRCIVLRTRLLIFELSQNIVLLTSRFSLVLNSNRETSQSSTRVTGVFFTEVENLSNQGKCHNNAFTQSESYFLIFG